MIWKELVDLGTPRKPPPVNFFSRMFLEIFQKAQVEPNISIFVQKVSRTVYYLGALSLRPNTQSKSSTWAGNKLKFSFLSFNLEEFVAKVQLFWTFP